MEKYSLEPDPKMTPAGISIVFRSQILKDAIMPIHWQKEILNV
jgi:hypothetical protein